MAQEKPEEPWPTITAEERTLHEILFYSQGPVDGYILGEGIRDLLLKSGLSLTVLSQIWNLADVSNDNVLNVHEFVLIMHLIRGVMQGRPVPKALPRSLTPPKTSPQVPPPMTQQEKDAYLRVFQTLDYSRAGVIDAQIAAEMFLCSKLSSEVLALVWDLSDFGRDGKLNPEEFAIACHLLRYAKQGGSLDGPVDIFKYAPQHISPLSLLARKRRVAEYEEHKQRLMSLKERRKVQAVREAKRFDLAKEKVELLQELYDLLKKLGKETEADKDFPRVLLKEKTDNEKQEEIVVRLKKEHEKVRQETVKIILGEQKFNNDITIIKKDTDELNKRLLCVHTHATKDPDPFHQLYEQRKEKRQGSTIKDLDKIDIHIPFEFSPFDLDVTPATLPSGAKILSSGNNHKQSVADVKSVIADLREFGEEFMDLWGGSASPLKEKNKDYEDDEIFREVHDWNEDNWPAFDWAQDGLLGLTDAEVVRLKFRLSDLREELKKLNSEGDRLVFRNPDDYLARKKAREEEEKAEKGRVQRRSATDRLRSTSSGGSRARDPKNRYSYSGERSLSSGDSEAAQAAREYRLKRRSQNLDSASSSPDIHRNPDHDIKSYQKSTSPTSISDEASLSRESSLSSADQPVVSRRSVPKPDEETSTVRTQLSSRTDDSGVLTLRSSRRKDDLSLELASVALGRQINVEVIPTPVSSERAEQLQRDAEKGEQKLSVLNDSLTRTTELQTQVEKVDPLQQEQKKERETVIEDSVEDSKPKSPETPRRSSKRHRAPPPPATVNPLPSVHGDLVIDGKETSGKEESVITSNEVVKQVPQSPVLSSKQVKHPVTESQATSVVSVPQSSKSVLNANPGAKEKDNLQETKSAPQRPPRLKKRSTSDSPRGSPLSSPVAVKVNISLQQQNHQKQSLESQTTEKKGGSSKDKILDSVPDLKETKSFTTRPPSKKKRPAPVPDENKLCENVKSDDLSHSNSSTDKQTARPTETEPTSTQKQKSVSQTVPRSNLDNKVGQNTLEKAHYASEEKTTVKSDRMLRVSASPVNSHNTDSSQKESLPHFRDGTETKSRGDFTPSEPSDSDAESVPPPLPSSAPPPLPSAPPPTIPGDREEDEEVVTVEYTVPVKISTTNNGVSVSTLESPDGTMNTSTGSTDKTSPSSLNISPKTNINENEAGVPSPTKSKTTSDLRSDFFGLKSSRPQTESPRTDDLESREKTPLDVYFNDVQTEAKLNEKVPPLNLMDSDAPDDNDSGVHKGRKNGSFSPADSGNPSSSFSITPEETDNSTGLPSYTKAPLLSSQKRTVLSNESVESAFEGTFSNSSASSLKLSSRPQTLFENDQTTTHSSKSLNQQNNSSSPLSSSSSSFNTPPQTTANVISVSRPSPASPTSPTQSLSYKDSSVSSPTEERYMSPRSQEIVDKARHFAEMIQPKQTFVVKREKEVNIEDDFSQDALQGLEKERRSVISQSTVKRKVNTALSPVDDRQGKESRDSIEGSGAKSPVDTSNPSNYGYIYSAERPKPAPEVGWTERQTDDQKINLYSENVVKEGDTTETVDRESIANLSSTKKQWENIFTSKTDQAETPRKKSAPKWEVRLPYKEKHAAPVANSANQDELQSPREEAEEDPAMYKKAVDTESAIEREIRLAHEREEMLKREKEERQKHTEKQHMTQGQTIIASYEAVSAESESCQPAYNELAEADRGPDLWRVETGGRQQDSDEDNDAEDVNPNESIIEREIRLQREREAEIARMRRISSGAQPAQEQLQQPQLQQQQYSTPPQEQYNGLEEEEDEDEDINHNQTKGLKYEDAISNKSHEGESLIARELRELKEREDEIKRLHSNLQGTQIRDEVDGQTETSTPARKPSSLNAPPANSHMPTLNTPSPGQGTWQRDVSPFVSENRRASVDSLSSHSTGRTPSDHTPSRRDVRVQPIADGREDDEDEKPNYFQRQETPIEREMRIARERENELRRLKGLPDLVQKDDEYDSYGATTESSANSSITRPRSMGQPGDSMKKFASSRLQQELMQQKKREIALRSEGKIISTSEEHIQPLKYMEVAGVDKVDGKEKRNFVTKKTSISSMEPISPGTPEAPKSPNSQTPTRKTSAAAGGQLFSYKEFKQTAESKIERELREMREREEELRKQRTSGQPDSPR